jgi:hypothetical protein
MFLIQSAKVQPFAETITPFHHYSLLKKAFFEDKKDNKDNFSFSGTPWQGFYRPDDRA